MIYEKVSRKLQTYMNEDDMSILKKRMAFKHIFLPICEEVLNKLNYSFFRQNEFIKMLSSRLGKSFGR